MAIADPAAPPESLIFSKFDGLKNTLNPERLGPRDLVRATNVDLDDDGQLSRRRGYKRVIEGNAHSPFTTTGGIVLLVIDGVLGILHPDYSFEGLQSGIATDPSTGVLPIQYTQIGHKIYFTSAQDQGIIDMDLLAVTPWGTPGDIWLSPVVNPTATLPPIAGRRLGPPPNATCMDYYRGRIWLAHNKIVWCTELFVYDLIDVDRNFYHFEDQVTMIQAVDDGLWIGTTAGLFFMSGTHAPDGLKRSLIMNSGVIPGSVVNIPSELGNPPQTPPNSDTQMQIAVAFMTTTGFCVASDGGQAYNLTESKFFFPGAHAAAAMYRRQDGMNQYVTSLQSGGDPVNNAKIGDYVEATIIRGAANGAWIIAPPEKVQVADTLTPTWSTAEFVEGVKWEAGDSVAIHETLAPTWS